MKGERQWREIWTSDPHSNHLAWIILKDLQGYRQNSADAKRMDDHSSLSAALNMLYNVGFVAGRHYERNQKHES